jgi:RNA ligase
LRNAGKDGDVKRKSELMKPLGKKSYGSIPHLLGSKLGEGDHHVHEGQHRICTGKTRDKHDLIIIQEKYDGSNVAVSKLNGKIIALTRSGYLAHTSPFEQHHYFWQWVEKNESLFDRLLNEGERVCGEWLLQAHGLKYEIEKYPFVAFDLFVDNKRLNYIDFCYRVFDYLIGPKTIWKGGALETPVAYHLLSDFPHEVSSTEKPEGLIYRVERKGEVDFLAKFVRRDFVPGKYLPEISGKEPVFNYDLNLI